MALRELNINPIIDIVDSVVEENKEQVKGVITEHDMLEVRVGRHANGFSGPHLEPFGQVTLEIPTGYVVVRNVAHVGSGLCQAEHEALMREIAQSLSTHYEVAYLHGLTPQHRKKYWRRS